MRFFAILVFVFISVQLKSNTTSYIVITDTTTHITEVISCDFSDEKPNPIFNLIKKRQKNQKKIISAILAFPFPFGIVGLHRIYLGTKPYVPVTYIASLGGVFGVLPLIDFFAILTDKNFEHYNNNGSVFMWIKK